MKASEAAKMVAVLRAAFARDTIGDDTSPVYERYLADLEAKEVWPAVDEIIATRKWFPTVAEIRTLVVQRRISAPSVAKAFSDIARYQHDQAKGEVFKASEYMPPIAQRAFALCGGLHGYRNSTAPGVWRSQFRKIYEELLGEEILVANVSGAGQLAGQVVKGLLNA